MSESRLSAWANALTSLCLLKAFGGSQWKTWSKDCVSFLDFRAQFLGLWRVFSYWGFAVLIGTYLVGWWWGELLGGPSSDFLLDVEGALGDFFLSLADPRFSPGLLLSLLLLPLELGLLRSLLLDVLEDLDLSGEAMGELAEHRQVSQLDRDAATCRGGIGSGGRAGGRSSLTASRRGGRRVADLTSSSVIGVDFGGGLRASFAISPDFKSEDRLVTRLVLLSCLSSP